MWGGAMIKFLKDVLGFLVLEVVYWLVAIIAYIAVYIINRFFEHAVRWISAPWAVIVGATVGVVVAVTILDHFFKPYPQKVFGSLFIGINVIFLVWGILLWTVGHEPFGFKDFTSSLGLVVGSFAAWWLLWRGERFS